MEPGTVTDSPSALLERAAELIEQRAAAATVGPWRFNPAKHHHEPGTAGFSEAVFAGEPGADAVCVATTGDSDDLQSMHDAAWIAMLDPIAAQPLVEWLRDAARRMELHPHLSPEGSAMQRTALAFAILVLGEHEKTP